MRPTVDQRRIQCRDRLKLAHYEIPRYIHIVDEFPMTATGKVRQVEMRTEWVRLLGL
jgi:fatty-acyl-CoA synthase